MEAGGIRICTFSPSCTTIAVLKGFENVNENVMVRTRLLNALYKIDE